MNSFGLSAQGLWTFLTFYRLKGFNRWWRHLLNFYFERWIRLHDIVVFVQIGSKVLKILELLVWRLLGFGNYTLDDFFFDFGFFNKNTKDMLIGVNFRLNFIIVFLQVWIVVLGKILDLLNNLVCFFNVLWVKE